MLALKKLGIFFLVVNILSSTLGLHVIKLDAERLAIDRRFIDRVFMRSNASGEKTVLITGTKSLDISLCLNRQELFLVSRVVYSTDGFPIQVDVNINQDVIGQFTTHSNSNWGHLWNQFYSTGSIGLATILNPGQHTVRLSIAQESILSGTAQNGIEIDYLEFAFSKSKSLNSVLCEGQIEDQIPGINTNINQNADQAGRQITSQTGEQTGTQITGEKGKQTNRMTSSRTGTQIAGQTANKTGTQITSETSSQTEAQNINVPREQNTISTGEQNTVSTDEQNIVTTGEQNNDGDGEQNNNETKEQSTNGNGGQNSIIDGEQNTLSNENDKQANFGTEEQNYVRTGEQTNTGSDAQNAFETDEQSLNLGTEISSQTGTQDGVQTGEQINQNV